MKKGQVTLFIIIGLILLFTTTLLIYYQASFVFRERFTPYMEQVPAEVLPIKQFVTGCLEQTTKRAITTLARQGGTIKLSQFVAEPKAPTEGNALSVTKSWTVPYWWHLASPNTCTEKCEFKQFFPYVHKEDGPDNAETQLAEFIAEQLPICTGKFADFPAASVDEVSPIIEVFVAEDAVQVNALYPLHATINGKSHALTRFYAKQDVKLPQLYKTAQAIAQEEAKQRFLELQAMELVTVYSGLDKKKLPPVSETVFFPKPLFWLTTEVKAMLQNILGTYAHLFRMRTAQNAFHKKINEQLPYSAVLSQFYDSFLIPIVENVPYQTHFQYFPDWPMYLTLNDKGGVLMPEQASPQILPIPLVVQRYSTIYDFSFPMLVELYDSQAFNGAGLSFFFALEGNVRANSAMNITSDQMETVTGEEGMLCDPIHRNKQNTTIIVHDESGAAMQSAVVSFGAGDTCLIGETNAKGILVAQFPIAIGMLSVIPQSMMLVSLPFIVQMDTSSLQDITVSMSGKIPVAMKAKQIFHDKAWHTGGVTELDNNDNVLVTFERHQNIGEGYFQTAAQFTKENPKQDVMLATGTYDVRIISTQDINITLSPKKQCFETSGAFGLNRQEQCITIPEETMIMAPPPQVVETTITLSREDIKSGKQVTLFAPKIIYPPSPAYDDMFVDTEILAKENFAPK